MGLRLVPNVADIVAETKRLREEEEKKRFEAERPKREEEARRAQRKAWVAVALADPEKAARLRKNALKAMQAMTWVPRNSPEWWGFWQVIWADDELDEAIRQRDGFFR